MKIWKFIKNNIINGIPQEEASYTRGQRLEAISYKDGTKAYPIYNGHSDVIELRDNQGEILNRYDYDVWGNLTLKEEKVHNPFRYSGELWDDTTGLQYLRARWYDPSVGRFINEDTFDGLIDDPLSLNLYTYVGNNPLIRFDPSGNSWMSDQWNAYVIQMKSVHSSWETAMSYWTMGFTDPFFTSARVAMNTKEYWYAQAEVIFNTAMLLQGNLGRSAAVIEKTEVSSVVRIVKNTCNCFTGDTKVQTDDGEKNIEDIEVGDKVLSKNEETGEVAYNEVTATFNHETDEIYQIQVGDQVIESTYNHPFWVEDKGWTYVKDLHAGDLLVKSDGNTLKIESIELLHKQVTVYNITVDDFHTYFVSDLGVWVHNTGPCPFGKYEDAPYHGTTNNSLKNKAPINGQDALNNSLSIGLNTDRRIAVSNGEFVVLDKTSDGLYHGLVRSWSELTPTMQAILRKEGLVEKKGRIK